jgi:hypothetical protein
VANYKTLLGSAAVAGLGLVVLAGCSADPYRQTPTRGEMAVDAAVVRPMTLATSAVGLAGWVVTLPFTFPTETMGEVGQAWVLDPLKYTVARPLGEMREQP